MFKRILETFERIGRVRAAHVLAQQGLYEEAKRIMCRD